MRHISSMVWLTRLVVLGCICYSTLQNTAVAAAAAAEAASSNATLPSTLSRQGPSKICACAASTYDSKDCTAAVTAYCSGNSTADASFCSGMLDLGQLKTNQTAASMLVGFLATICKPAAGTVMDVCDCFKAPSSDACALAKFKLCADGDALCPAITLGLGATPDQAAYGRVYNSKTCQSNSPLEVELVFAGVDQDTFNADYAAKTAAALANVTGVNIDQVSYNKTTAAPVLEKKDTNATANTTATPNPNTTTAQESAVKPDAAAAAVAPPSAPAAAAAAVAAKAPAVEPPAAVEKPVPAVPEKVPAPAPKPSEPKPVAAKPVVIAEPVTPAEDAAAAAAAKSKSFDSWASTPACDYSQTPANFKLDRLGRPWGYNSATGASCAFKAAAAAPTPAYEDAPECSYKLTASNALPDKLGRLWGYDSATGASCVFKAAAASAPAKTAAVAAKPAAAAPSKGSRRMLLQVLLPDGPAANATSVDGLAVMKYTIAAADAGRARRRLMSAVQEDGQAFYDALSKAGVPYKPSVTVSGQKLLLGDVPPSINLSPRSGVLTYYDATALGITPPPTRAAASAVDAEGGLPLASVVGIIVGSVVGGFAVIGLSVWCCCLNRKRKTPAERLREEEDAANAKLGPTKDVELYGATLREKFVEAQKPIDQRAILTYPDTPTSVHSHVTAHPVTPPAATAANRSTYSTAVPAPRR